MAEPSATNDEIMSLLLGDNEEEEDIRPVVEAVLSMDDVTVEVDQYSIRKPNTTRMANLSLSRLSSSGVKVPTLSSTVASQNPQR